jgi:hypothetical protein
MGRLATVQPNFVGVSLPSATGVNQALGAGQTVVLTEAEAVSAPVAALVTLGAITLATANSSPEPTRPQADKLAYPNVNEAQFTATTGGTVYIGSNVVTGPAAGVTYVAGFLNVAANNPKVGTTTASKSIIFPAYPGSGQVGNKTFTETAIVNNPATVGAVSGGLTELNVFHVQGAVVSVAPVAKNWIAVGGVTQTVKWPAGTVPTFTASVGAVDYFQFVTYDGGTTWLNTVTIKGLA